MSRLLGCVKVSWVQGLFVSGCVAACSVSPSLAQPGSHAGAPDDGGLFQWSTVNLSGNAPYMGNPGNLPASGIERALLLGRGTVAAPFRISRTEMTHAQWLPFLNALNGNPAVFPQLNAYFTNNPVSLDISGQLAPGFNFASGPGGTQTYTIRNQGWANVPVEMTWRMAALYCNWMHNGRTGTFNSFMTGAYNVYSWGDNFNGTFTDAAARMPGARFWIPNIDEHLKASHYDPNRYGPNQGGYWLRGTSSDTAPIFGTPAEGGQALIGNDSFLGGGPTSVGMFPTVQSPWGLLDVAGGMGEWLEDARIPGFGGPPSSRHALGFVEGGDLVFGVSSGLPALAQSFTLRIASSVPSPSSISVIGLGLLVVSRRRR